MEILENLSCTDKFSVCGAAHWQVSEVRHPAPESPGAGVSASVSSNVMPLLLPSLRLLDERDRPGGAAWNMAMDEALLMTADCPVLRVYRWETPALSFGYFLPWQVAENVSRGRVLVRRWTGGGMVEHGDDFTWSLIVPSGMAIGRTRPAESYRLIHGALGTALEKSGIVVEQVPASAPVPAGGWCFTAPAPGDLLVTGSKIAGAGQRRCRHGLLHQSSLCGVSLPDDFPHRLAAAMSETVETFPPSRVPAAAADERVRGRYGSDSWLRRC